MIRYLLVFAVMMPGMAIQAHANTLLLSGLVSGSAHEITTSSPGRIHVALTLENDMETDVIITHVKKS